MKKLITITCMLIASIITTNAQTLASAAPLPEEKAAATAAPAPSVKYEAPSVSNTSMSVEETYVSFSNLPERGDVAMYLTDDRGNVLSKKTLTSRHNSVDISRLHKGVHFITLESAYAGTRKTFMLSLQ